MSAVEEITGHYTSIDGTRTFYDERGEGTPIVCVHTAGADSREYQYLLPLLAQRGYRALAPDLPGHSRSLSVQNVCVNSGVVS
jgi:pimeloyl-ACP methyl ester carboxylesterase